MGKIVFFSIPAYGHTNPTIPVVKELINGGNEVWYYSFNEFKEKIEGTGANYISCDGYLPELRPEDEKKIGKDFSALIAMVVDTTIKLDEKVCRELEEIQPDCIVADSICIWGKLFALKKHIPYICSTTTFAFNQHTAKKIKRKFSEIFYMLVGMKKINEKLKVLQANGYDVSNFISLIQNDNDTNTIVYTSKEFQPCIETFSERYVFIGPSIDHMEIEKRQRKRPVVYISLGTVMNRNSGFYKNCIEAFKNDEIDVIMSVGTKTDIASLGKTPDNFQVSHTVEQKKVLQNVDVFLTHCGMNSVNESIYYKVPMVLFPQQSEEGLVAGQAAALGVGIILKKGRPENIREAVFKVQREAFYKDNIKALSESFKKAGGAKRAADFIEKIIENK